MSPVDIVAFFEFLKTVPKDAKTRFVRFEKLSTENDIVCKKNDWDSRKTIGNTDNF